MVPVVVGVGAFWLELRAQAREDERATLQRDLAERLETLQLSSLEALAELQEKNDVNGGVIMCHRGGRTAAVAAV